MTKENVWSVFTDLITENASYWQSTVPHEEKFGFLLGIVSMTLRMLDRVERMQEGDGV